MLVLVSNRPGASVHPIASGPTTLPQLLTPLVIHIHCRVLMAAFSAVSPFADMFLFFIPLYYEAKLALAIYLWANNLAGASLVYHRYAEPYIHMYEPLLDKKIAEVKTFARTLVSTNFARAIQWLQAKAVAVLTQQHAAPQSHPRHHHVSHLP